jgi:maleate cis-trans isomerase
MVTVEYGSRGILGLLVPQANTTAEPEVNALLGADLALLVGRLTSAAPEMRERLDHFLERIESYIDTFGDAPLAVLGFLITGSTYPMQHDEEDEFFARLGTARGYPVVSAAQSIRRAFAALGAKRIGVVSPYPAWLTERSLDYWRRTGVNVVGVEAPERPGGFHEIYTMRGPSVLAAARRLAGKKPDVVLLAGAGMPTLGPMMALVDEGVTPLSSNFCMAWQIEQIGAGAPADAASLRRLLRKDSPWRKVFAARFPAAATLKQN